MPEDFDLSYTHKLHRRRAIDMQKAAFRIGERMGVARIRRTNQPLVAEGTTHTLTSLCTLS